MTEDHNSEWAQTLTTLLADTIEFKGPAYMEWYYSPANDNAWGVDLIRLFPAIIEIEEAGPNDGEEIFGIVHHFDLLAAQKAFDKVDALVFSFDNDGQPEISIEGKYTGRDVVVLINFQPVPDDEDDFTEEKPDE